MKKTKNIIRDQIFTCIEVSRRSKVPMLFMSNPGYGKTTSIDLYAKTYGYHVETLIGSHYSQDEILGFQANTGSKHLSILEPEWYTRIMYAQSKGIPSILFLDELSTVSPSVQGALLQLCFERKIRGGKSLPENCIVIAAANYKPNLPGFSDIIAPELNRFCIINLLPPASDKLSKAAINIIEEFTQDFHEITDDIPQFKTNYKFSEEQNKQFLEQARSQLKSLFLNHSREKSTSSSTLDFRNIYYDGIYDRADGIPEVYNFISPRTISYYLRVVRTLCEMGIEPGNKITTKFVDGLIGLGTNTWNKDDDVAFHAQLRFFLNELYDMTSMLIRKFSSSTGDKVDFSEVEEEMNELIPESNTLTNKIRNYISRTDTKAISVNSDFTTLLKKIGNDFDTLHYNTVVKRIAKNPSQFRSDYESIRILYELINERLGDNKSMEMNVYLKSLKSIIEKFESAYQDSFAA